MNAPDPTWCEAFGWVDAYDRMEQTWVGNAIRESIWLFPGVEAIHLLGLAMLGGSVLVADLRLLGVGLRHLPAAQVVASTRPWFLGSLALMVATGVPLFLSEAVKCCFNHSFEVKMVALACGTAFTLLVRNRVAGRAGVPAWAVKAAGAVSLALWITVAAAGRWIGFSG